MQVTLTLQNIFPSNFAMVFWIIIPNKNTDNTSCIGNLLKILIVDSWPFARLYLLKNHELGILTLLNKEKIPSAMWTYFKICSLCKKKKFKRIKFHFHFSLHWKYSMKAIHWHNVIVYYTRFPFLQIIQRLHLLNISWGKNQIMPYSIKF